MTISRDTNCSELYTVFLEILKYFQYGIVALIRDGFFIGMPIVLLFYCKLNLLPVVTNPFISTLVCLHRILLFCIISTCIYFSVFTDHELMDLCKLQMSLLVTLFFKDNLTLFVLCIFRSKVLELLNCSCHHFCAELYTVTPLVKVIKSLSSTSRS